MGNLNKGNARQVAIAGARKKLNRALRDLKNSETEEDTRKAEVSLKNARARLSSLTGNSK